MASIAKPLLHPVYCLYLPEHSEEFEKILTDYFTLSGLTNKKKKYYMAYYLGGKQSIKDEKYAFKLCQKTKQKTCQMKLC